MIIVHSVYATTEICIIRILSLGNYVAVTFFLCVCVCFFFAIYFRENNNYGI